MKGVVVYGMAQGCPHCDNAKRALTANGVDFKFVDVMENPDFMEFFKLQHRTVPQIYQDGKHLGDSTVARTIKPEVDEEDGLDW